ncbi:hypothetical protein ACFL4L_01815 [bacterium]
MNESLNHVWHTGRNAIRQNLIPGLFLLIFGILIIVAYYWLTPVHYFLSKIAEMKEHGGYLFSILSTALFGGLIPYLYQIVTGQIRKGAPVIATGIFMIVFYGYRGFEVDLFYQFQARLFGEGLLPYTIIKKIIVDQFIYAPFWAIPMITIGLMFKNCYLSWAALKPALNRRFLTDTMPTVILSTWVIWIPGVAIIYSFPFSLQIPIMNFIVCFYTLMVLKIAKVN